MSVLDGPRKEVRRIRVGDGVFSCRVDGDLLVLEDGRTVAEASAVYAPPVEPSTIVCVHLNYRSRAREFGRDLEDQHPTYFLKPAGSVNAHRERVFRPADCGLLNYEGEVAAVVGKTMSRVRPQEVWDHLVGFCCANDFGAHDFRDTDAGSMLRVKGQDGFCPLGPGLVSGFDIRRSNLRTFVNQIKVQEAPLSEMVWGIDELFADITRHVTLGPGDVVLTGTPWHSRPVFPGDIVEVEIDGVGRLRNVIAETPAPDRHRGFPATVTKTSLGVALGSDYAALKRPGEPPTPEQYREARDQLIRENMALGPKRENQS